MRILFCSVVILLLTRSVYAGEGNISGELGHGAEGAALAGGFTAFAEKYYPDHQKTIGFLASSAVVAVGESIRMSSQDETFSSALRELEAPVLGAAVGAMTADSFALTPVIKRDKAGDSFAGIALRKSF